MAYIKPKIEEEEGGQPPAPTSGGEAGIVAGDGSPPPPMTMMSSGEGGAGSKGTGFVDLRRYLEENAPKTGAFAEKIGTDVEGKGDEVRTSADKVSDEYQTKTKGLNTYDPSWIDQVAKTPEKFTGPEDLERFTARRTGTFRGAKSLDDVKDWGDVKTSKGKALDYSNLTNAPGGIEEISAGYSSDPSKGKGLLNSALIQESKPAQERLTSARDNVALLDDYLSGKATAYGDTTAGLQDTLAANAPGINTQFGQVAQSFGNNLSEAYGVQGQKERMRRQAIINKLNKEIDARNSVSEANARARGQSQYGVWNPMEDNFTTPFTREQFGSEQDYAREHALEKLMGTSYDFLPDDASQAGTWEQRMADYNKLNPLAIGDPNEWRQVSPNQDAITPAQIPGAPPTQMDPTGPALNLPIDGTPPMRPPGGATPVPDWWPF